MSVCGSHTHYLFSDEHMFEIQPIPYHGHYLSNLSASSTYLGIPNTVVIIYLFLALNLSRSIGRYFARRKPLKLGTDVCGPKHVVFLLTNVRDMTHTIQNVIY